MGQLSLSHCQRVQTVGSLGLGQFLKTSERTHEKPPGRFLETKAKWAAQLKIEVLATLQKSWEKKLLYISSLLEKLEEQVINAPAAACQDEADTSNSRQFNFWEQNRIFDEAKQVFV